MSRFISLRFTPLLLSALLAILAPGLLLSQAPAKGSAPPGRGASSPERRHVAGLAADSATLKLNRSGIDFGTVDFGARPSDSVALMNTGNSPLTLGTVRIKGSGAQAFSLGTGLDGISIPASRFAWQSVGFHPADTGCYDAWLVVASSAGSDSIPLRGCSRYAAVQLGHDTLDFGLIRVDSCALLVDSIPNTLSDTLRLLDVVVSGKTYASATPPPTDPVVVPPGGIIGPVSIRFCPDGRGFIVGSFVLVTDRGTFTIDLWGRGGAPVIDVEPPSLDFGSVPVGRHRDLPVTVRNLGEFPLHVTRSAEPGPFSLAPGEPADFSLPVGGSRSLSFRFLPDMIGRVARTDTLRTNTVEGMVRLPLRGSGGEEYALHLDTVSGAVGDTLRLHLLIDPSYDSSGRTVGWVARLRVDPHALRIIGPSAPNPLHVSMTRLGDDTVRLAGLSSIPRDGILATIDILGLSTALPVNSVRLLDVVSDSLAVVAGWDGLVLLSGCIIGNAAPLERRSAILGLRWDASGALTVRYRLPGSATGRVRVVDMLAREVARAAVPGPGDQEREIVLPMTGLPRGIYFVELLVADDRSIMPVMGGG